MAAQYRQASSVRRREYIYTDREVSARPRARSARVPADARALRGHGRRGAGLRARGRRRLCRAGRRRRVPARCAARRLHHRVHGRGLADAARQAAPRPRDGALRRRGVALHLLEPAAQEREHGVRRPSAHRPVRAAVPRPGARGAQWQRERPALSAHDVCVRERPGGLRGGQPASIAGLDGTFRLTRGQTVWLSTTHLCFAPVRPTPTDHPLLLFDVDAQDKLRTRMIDLDVFDPAFAFDDRCAEALETRAGAPLPDRGGQRGARVAHAERPLPVRVRLRRAGEAAARRRGGRELLGAHRGACAPARHLPLRLRPGPRHVRGAALGALSGAWPRAGSASTCRSTARAASSRSTPPRSRTSSRPTRTRSPRRARACSCCCSRPRWSSCAARRTPPRRAGC